MYYFMSLSEPFFLNVCAMEYLNVTLSHFKIYIFGIDTLNLN